MTHGSTGQVSGEATLTQLPTASWSTANTRRAMRRDPIQSTAPPPRRCSAGRTTLWGCGITDRSQPGRRLAAAVPAADPARRRRPGVPDVGDLAAHQGAVLLPGPDRGLAGRSGDRRTRAPAVVPAARRGDRHDLRPGPGEPLPARLHHRPGSRRGVLAVPAHPQAGPPQRAHPHCPRTGSPNCRSSSTRTSSTLTGSPPNK